MLLTIAGCVCQQNVYLYSRVGEGEVFRMLRIMIHLGKEIVEFRRKL